MSRFVRHRWQQWFFEGMLAGLASTAVLWWRGRVEAPAAASTVNAPSHWVWGDEALERGEVDTRHTALGLAIHQASSLFWATAFRWLRERRSGRGGLLADATLVTAAAAFVDLRAVPSRLTPGFEHHLSRGSLTLVYLSFGAGLLLAALRDPTGPGVCTSARQKHWRPR
jgi:hypothetical protein